MKCVTFRKDVSASSSALLHHRAQGAELPSAQSVDKVQRIVEDFRTGKRDVAEFWIQMSQAGVPLFVHPVLRPA